MTEAEWLACEDGIPMLVFLEAKVDNRKLHLFACACCHRIWQLLPDGRSRLAVEVAERLADGLAERAEWDALYEEAKREQLFANHAGNAAYHAGYPMPLGARHTLGFAAATRCDDTKADKDERLAG